MLDNILGGSGVVISEVIRRVTIAITHIRGLITVLLTTHEPPSRHPKPYPAGGTTTRGPSVETPGLHVLPVLWLTGQRGSLAVSGLGLRFRASVFAGLGFRV